MTDYFWLEAGDNSTYWCFDCQDPYDAARLRAASLQCRREDSHRDAMLSMTSLPEESGQGTGFC